MKDFTREHSRESRDYEIYGNKYADLADDGSPFIYALCRRIYIFDVFIYVFVTLRPSARARERPCAAPGRIGVVSRTPSRDRWNVLAGLLMEMRRC